MNLALIGCGRMGRRHLEAASRIQGIRIVAIVDPTPPPDAMRLTATLDSVLAQSDTGVDAVVIASPTATHEKLVRQALECGKHVLCEKPLTLDASHDLALGALAERLGLILQVGFWRRFAQPYLRLRAVLASGAIGEATAIRAAQWDAHPPKPSFCDAATSGGIEIDCGVHEFDLVRWILDAGPAAVTAAAPAESGQLADVADVETVFGLARLSGGRTMAIDLTRTAGHRDSIRTEVIGTAGSIVVEFTETGAIAVRAGGRLDTIPLAVEDVIATALQEQLSAFSRAASEGRPHPDAADARDSYRATAAGHALRRARIKGGWHKARPPATAHAEGATEKAARQWT